MWNLVSETKGIEVGEYNLNMNKNAYQHCVALYLVLFHWSAYS